MSNANDDLPDPDSPVNTMRRSRGNSNETFFRLCSRAPRIRIASDETATTPPLIENDVSVVQVVGERMFEAGYRLLIS